MKSEIMNINNQLNFYQDSLMSMLSNLVACNKINIYAGTNTSFMIILDELKEINDLLKSVPNKISVSTLKDTSLNDLNLLLYKVYKLLITYSNHISFENFNYILELFGGKNWINNFNDNDLEKLLFLSRFFKPMCVWDSEDHKQGVPFPSKTEPKKKNAIMAKDLLESLLGGGNKSSSIIVGDNSMPAFLKSINDLIQTSPKKGRQRDNEFNKIECIGILDRNNIKITKNSKSCSLFEDKFGACVYLKIGTKFLVIQGIFKDDVLNISRTIPFVNSKYKDHKSAMSYNLYDVPKTFKNNYLKIINLRDLVACTTNELCDELKKKFHDFKGIQGKPLLSLINEFLLASKYRKVDILTLLLMSNEDDQKLAYVLYDVLKSKDKKNIAGEIYESLHYSIRELLESSQKLVEEDEEKLEKLSTSDIPYERRISLMKTDEDVKTKAMEKLKSIKNSFQGDNKAQAWLDGLLKVPFGSFSKNYILEFKGEFSEKLKLQYPDEKFTSDIQISNFLEANKEKESKLLNDWNNYLAERTGYLKNVRSKLDEAVYGHKEAKTQLERIFAQWINGEAKGAVLGLQGPPGTGKTSLAKNGLSKCLLDKNGESRPFAFLPIGGSVNGSTLVGHNFTYVGSTWGRIADVLISSKCMNPIIFIDEVDKVSQTEHGREIISILTHLTDGTQNDEFEDKFFAGIKLDLSKALIVFSFNDVSLIDPILRDRITIIETNPLSISEKVHIIQNYMLPEILKEVGLSIDEIEISKCMIKHIIETYTNEAGVRKIKEKIQEIVRDVNLNRFHDNEKYEIPFIVTEDYLNILFENKPRVRVKKIDDEPSVGLVNGLYATTSGIGGLTIIQVMKYPSEKMLDLDMTGKQGDVMKESVNYAKKIAYSLLTKEEQDKLIEDAQNKKAFGLHIHTPEAATPKDGPSAGAAMTLAIYSVLTGKRVNNKIAMTGEIDLCKRVTAIGGVEAKLNGAKRSGATKVLIPKDNEEDLEKMRRDGLSPEGDDFEVVLIDHIDQVLKHALVD